MILSFVNAWDIPQAWWMALQECLFRGKEYIIDQGSFVGAKRLELDHLTVRVQLPQSRPLVPVMLPEGVPAPTTMEYVEQEYLPYLLLGERKVDETYTYGEFISQQLPVVLDRLKRTPHTNQGYITIGKHTDFSDDPPCLRGIQIKIRNDKLHMCAYFRSWDLWAGLPSNLAGLQLLKAMASDELGVEDGELIVDCFGAHLYDYALPYAKKVCGMRE